MWCGDDNDDDHDCYGLASGQNGARPEHNAVWPGALQGAPQWCGPRGQGGDVATPSRTRALANAVKRPKLDRLLRRRQLLPELDAIRQHRPKVLLRLRLLALLLRLRLLRRLRLLGVANSQAHHDS